MKNNDIRLLAAGSGVKLWEIAKELGVNDGNLSRKLREELTPEKKQEIIDIIKRLAADRSAT